jgi:5-methyltetrahydrofolate--homocysteine methyltransferase
MTKALVEAIADMREDDALRLAQEHLDAGTPPLAVLDACREAMAIVGQRFEAGECFVPELILAGEMLKQISALVKPRLTQAAEARHLGRAVIGTVQGDIHDIGKDIVAFMLDVNGFDVLDLGVDVPPEKFVAAAKEFHPQVVGLSGFLTLAYEPMKATVAALRELSLPIKVMIGGGQIDEQIRAYTGADAYGKDAMAAVSLAKGWVAEGVGA